MFSCRNREDCADEKICNIIIYATSNSSFTIYFLQSTPMHQYPNFFLLFFLPTYHRPARQVLMFLVIIIFIIRHNSTIKLISRKDLTERTVFPPPERLIKWDRTGSIEGWRRLLSPVHDVVVIVIISRSPPPVPVRKRLSDGVIIVMILVSDILIMVVGGTDAVNCCMSQSMILGLLVVAIPSLPSLLIDATSFGCPNLVAAPLPLHDSESMPNLSGLSFCIDQTQTEHQKRKNQTGFA